MIKIATVLGSAHSPNITAMALALAQEELRGIKGVEVLVVDPSKLRLFIPGMEDGPSDRDRLQKLIGGADGVILATPEYHGSFSSLIKVVIENLGYPSALSGKPVSMLGIAGGRFGAIKSLEHLRSVCSHVGALVLPGEISIPRAGTVFDEHGRCLVAEVEQDIRGLAQNLVGFIRETKCPDISSEEMARKGLE